MTSITDTLTTATETLRDSSDTARMDAEVLLAYILEKERAYLHAWPERKLDARTLDRFQSLLARRAAGEPIAHITEIREFWSLPLRVSAATLIPRPETELLVELALQRLPRDIRQRVADLGTGSGAIALALASERPLAQILATDKSAAALAVARANRDRLGFANVDFAQGDWCTPLAGEQYDMIVCNPPYIAAGDAHLAQGDLRREPAAALISGDDGFDDLRKVITAARACLRPGASLLLEHGHEQHAGVLRLLMDAGYSDCTDHRDVGGNDRVTIARR